MLGSWSSIAEDTLECSYTMLCETSCYNRKQAFLQIRINEDDRNAMRFNWIKDREILETVILQFTRLIFFFYSLFKVDIQNYVIVISLVTIY